MRRRDFIGSGLAVGALAAALPAMATPESTSVEALVAGAEERSARLRQLTQPLRDAMIDLEGKERDPELLDDLVDSVEALLETNYLGELAAEEQAHPRVQRRFRRATRRTGRSLRRLVRRLDRLPPERVAEMQRVMEEQPEVFEAAVRRMQLEVAAIGMPMAAQHRVSDVAGTVWFRMRRQPLQGVLDDFVDQFQRTEQLAALGGTELDVDTQRVGVPGVEFPEPMKVAPRRPAEPKADPTAAGAVALGMSLATLGALAYKVGGSGGFALLCVCVSAPIVLAVLLLLVASATLLSEK